MNTFSYTMKAPFLFSRSIWAFINSAKHRHLEFLLRIPMEKNKNHFLPSSCISHVFKFTCLQTTYTPLYLSAPLPLMLTRKAKSAKKTRQQEIYVTLVHLLQHSDATAKRYMLWHSWSGQRWSKSPSLIYSMLCSAHIIQLCQGFIVLFKCILCSLNISLHRIIISIHFHWFTSSDDH